MVVDVFDKNERKSLHFCLHKGHIRYVNIVVYLMCLIVYLDTSLPALRVSSH